MQITQMVVGPLGSNAYLLRDDEAPDGAVVDPGGDGDQIAARCRAEGLEPRLIIDTHGHMDHIQANEQLKAAFPQAQLCIGEGDAPMLTNGVKNLSILMGTSFRSPEADLLLADGQVLEFGGCRLEVLETPGHTPGSICLLAAGESPSQVFCGDLVFAGGVGRVDFPGGNMNDLLSSIRSRILTLPDETVLWPGHGPSTTVGRERRQNPFLQ
jgi:glyoxylase-like metal-dependent hydrolase (beta-lactamase superfamily II)